MIYIKNIEGGRIALGNPVKKMKKVKIAIIGCGLLGQIHADCLKEIPEAETVAYCDFFQEKANNMIKKYGGRLATTDPEDIFSDPDIDAVYIATLHDTHAEYSIRAMEAGKDVLCEKPLAMTVDECLKIAETAEKTGKKLMTAFKMRYYDLILKAKELIERPNVIVMQMMDDKWPDDFWANDPIKGGGNVISQGCHSCDIMRFIAGSNPIEVYAAGGNYYQKAGTVDNLTATFKFENGIAGSWIQGDCACPQLGSKFFMQIFAENKVVTLYDRFTTLTYQEAGKEPQTFKGTETGFMEENRAFVSCILNDAKPAVNSIDGLYATLMALQGMKSLEKGTVEPIKSLVAGYNL